MGELNLKYEYGLTLHMLPVHMLYLSLDFTVISAYNYGTTADNEDVCIRLPEHLVKCNSCNIKNNIQLTFFEN